MIYSDLTLVSAILMRKQFLRQRLNTIGKKLKYAIDKSRRWWHNRWKYQLIYNENLVESFWWLARNRMK